MKNFLMCKCSERWQALAPLFLRVVVGAVFLAHGWLKIGDVAAFAGSLDSFGVPAAGTVAFLVAWLEVLGGAALILGLLTHILSKLFAIEMVVALFLVHWGNGFYVMDNGYEFVLLLVAATVSLMVTGPGKWALDDKILKS